MLFIACAGILDFVLSLIGGFDPSVNSSNIIIKVSLPVLAHILIFQEADL